MNEIFEIIKNAYSGYAGYLWQEITQPHGHNYFYWLIAVSVFFFGLETIKPWRQSQPTFRKDFWLDVFYMFFNFFIFSLIFYNAASEIVVTFFNDIFMNVTGLNLKTVNPMYAWPLWSILFIGFLVRDFVQWWTHRLLHRVPFLWNFHKVHHSVEQMGFAAHLRYHWMETIVYRTIEYLPLAILGINLHDFFIIHIFTLAVGHYNHSNITVPSKISGGILGGLIGLAVVFNVAEISWTLNYPFWAKIGVCSGLIGIGYFILGPFMKKIFNSPEMHIWHHAYNLPVGQTYGINFGISLAIWDYLFGTAAIPHTGRDIALGFEGVESFPETFKDQFFYGIFTKK